MTKIKLIEINSEIGAGTRGASLGIDALKIASINANSRFFANFPSEKVKTENHILFKKPKKSFGKNIKTLTKVFRRHSDALKNVLNNGDFPIVLAGDHSSAAATIAGIKSAHPTKRLGVIWIDAHADLHSPYTSPSGNVHGMPLAISLGEDNLDCQRNDISEKTKKHWETLKMTSGMMPNILPQDLVFFGVRDTEIEENYLMDKHNIRNVSVTEVRMKGVPKAVAETNKYLKDCDLIYISFDVDSMDPFYVSHGTGTPVPVGFSESEATALMSQLLANKKVCCFEITEVNPTLDEKRNVMAETAFRILENSAGAVQYRE